jgi:hypothetical protein
LSSVVPVSGEAHCRSLRRSHAATIVIPVRVFRAAKEARSRRRKTRHGGRRGPASPRGRGPRQAASPRGDDKRVLQPFAVSARRTKSEPRGEGRRRTGSGARWRETRLRRSLRRASTSWRLLDSRNERKKNATKKKRGSVSLEPVVSDDAMVADRADRIEQRSAGAHSFARSSAPRDKREDREAQNQR